MGLFHWHSKTGGFMDEIRCDEPSYLIWKWHPSGIQPGKGSRENAIRWGSSLRVRDGEVAVLVYTRPDGSRQEFIEGPCDIRVETKNFPILANLVGLAYEGGTPFPAEVYFINLAQLVQVKFGVPFFDVYDPRFPDFGVPVAVRGTISFKITDYRGFIALHQLRDWNMESFNRQIRDAVSRYVKDYVANAPAAHNMPVIQLETKTAQINDAVELDIVNRFQENFGVTVSSVDIGAIEIDQSSMGYRQLMSVTKEISAAKVQAETRDYVERLRIQREEGQYSLHKQTQSANIGAFQVEKQAEVGVAGAEALGHMGENGAGNINLNDGGFNMASVMASMALGGAVGQTLAGTMNQAMNGQPSGMTPPPIPKVLYYVAVQGKPTGPYDLDTLKTMAVSGQLSGDSFVWTQGMKQWEKANTLADFQPIFPKIPPIPKK